MQPDVKRKYHLCRKFVIAQWLQNQLSNLGGKLPHIHVTLCITLRLRPRQALHYFRTSMSITDGPNSSLILIRLPFTTFNLTKQGQSSRIELRHLQHSKCPNRSR